MVAAGSEEAGAASPHDWLVDWSAAALEGAGGRHSVIALYTVDVTVTGSAPPRTWPLDALFEPGIYRTAFAAAADELPRLVGARRLDAASISLRQAGGLVRVHDACCLLFTVISGRYVGALWLTYELAPGHAPTRPLPELFVDIDRDRRELRLGDATLVDAFCGHLPGVALDLGLDFHALTLLAPGSWPPDADLDRHLAQKLVSRQDRPSREAFLTARFPAEANRYHDMLAAVTPGATAIAGHPRSARLAFVVSAIQALGSLATLRDIQRTAFAELRRIDTLVQADARGGEGAGTALAMLADAARRSGEVQVHLAFGVEAFLDLRLLVPSLPIQQYHADLVDALAIRSGARVAASMVDRLAQTVESERTALEASGHARSRAWGNSATLLAALVIPVTLILGFLGANVSQADPQATTSIWDHRYVVWYVFFLVAPALIGLAAWRLFLARFKRG